MKKYTVLWFDDECEVLESILDEALEFDIVLYGVTNADEGLQLLQNSPQKFDAVLLDGKFYENSTQSGDENDDVAFGKVIDFLISKNKEQHYLPWFILSGQPSFVKEKNPIVTVFSKYAKDWGGDRVFDKNDDNDSVILFEKMINAISSNSFFKLKYKYNPIFNLLTKEIFDSSTQGLIISLLMRLDKMPIVDSNTDTFNLIRKVLEQMQSKFIALDIIPSDMTLNSIPYFFQGKDNNYISLVKKPLTNPLIGHLLSGLIPLIQDGSHKKEGMRYNVDKHCSNGGSFLFAIVSYQLLEVLQWFAGLMENNDLLAKHKNMYKKKESEHSSEDEWKEGVVQSIALNNFGNLVLNDGTTVTIYNKMVLEFKVKEGDYLRVVTKPASKGGKLHIDKLEKIEAP